MNTQAQAWTFKGWWSTAYFCILVSVLIVGGAPITTAGRSSRSINTPTVALNSSRKWRRDQSDSQTCLTNKEAYQTKGCCAGTCGHAYEACYDCLTTKEQDPVNFGGPSCFLPNSCIAKEPGGLCTSPAVKQLRGDGLKYGGWCMCPKGSFCNGDGCNTTSPRHLWNPDVCPTCRCLDWEPTKCAPPAMGPDSNGECSCPTQHRCEGTVGRSSSSNNSNSRNATTINSSAMTISSSSSSNSSSSAGCVDDHLPPAPNDLCPYSNKGTCYEPQYCAVGTDCTDCGNCNPLMRATWHWNPHDCPSCGCSPWCDTDVAYNIICSDLGLTTLLAIDNKDAKYVQLTGNLLTALDDGLLFAGMKSLEVISLDDNNLTKISPTLFNHVPALQELDLENNFLSKLSPTQFASLLPSLLTVIRLQNNSLTEVPSTIFDNLNVLTKILLQNNNIQGLASTTFSGVPALTNLDLNRNNISELDSKIFSYLTALTVLDLSDNSLQRLEPTLFSSLTGLTNLRCSANYVNELDPITFSGLSVLTELRLSGNALRELDSMLFSELIKLETLYLDHNMLSVLSPTLFSSMPALLQLGLDSNALNQINSPVFSKLKAMIALDLSNNTLTELDSMLFAGLTELQSLDLSGNILTELDSMLFTDLTKIQYLYLEDNRLNELKPTLFSSTTKLGFLYLSGNQLTMVDQTTFAPVAKSMKALSMAGNNIQRVDSVLQSMRRANPNRTLPILVMEGNPSQCWSTPNTYQNPGGSIACSCAERFEYVQSGRGYMCQELNAGVIIPQNIVTLRSKRFVLRGPKDQLSLAENQTIDPAPTFVWNGYETSEGEITVKLHWSKEDVSTATIAWECNSVLCSGGGVHNIVNPPKELSDANVGNDRPEGFLRIGYFVITGPSGQLAETSTAAALAAEPPTTELRTAHVAMVYSAFYLPFRFDNATETIVEATAGAGLQSPRVLRIKEMTSAASTTNITSPSVDWLKTDDNLPATVTPNPYISTAITFNLINNTCNHNGVSPLSVRQVYATENRNIVVGWEVVVGEPSQMVYMDNHTMRPCTAVLQAHDSVTGENLTVTTIRASVKDCFESEVSASISATDTAALSCNGRGTCNPDLDMYDGNFMGCSCSGNYTGDRCEVTMSSCRPDERYNAKERACKGFNPVFLTTRRPGRLNDNEYTDPTEQHDFDQYVFTVGDTVRIRSFELDMNASAGDSNSTTYKLAKGAPPGFFVSSSTGEILGHFDPNLDSSTVQNFTITLQAVDASELSAPVETMTFRVKPKPRDVVVQTVVGCTVLAVVLFFCSLKLRQRYLAKKDAKAALVRARKAYGLVSLEPFTGNGISVNSGDLVGVTKTTNNAVFVGFEGDDSDNALLLNPASGYTNDLLAYDDDNEDDDDAAESGGTDGGVGSDNAVTDTALTHILPEHGHLQARGDKFVAPTISLGKSTLAAKGLDVLLGIDPKTYMHVKRKVKVMLKEFAKHGTDQDNKNLKTLLDGTYTNPPNSDGSPLTAEEVSGQSKTIDELMEYSDVQDAGLERHHVLALRLYTTSTYSSINNPMRQSPPVLPHPFAATLYYISDALSKLREVQGKDPALRNTCLVFWRGMKNLDISEEFVKTGGSEMACMSTTSSRSVAEEFALSESPLLFKFVSKSFMSHGASIGFLSVYPGEKEVLYPPLTYLRPIKMSEETIGTTVYKVVEVEPVFPK